MVVLTPTVLSIKAIHDAFIRHYGVEGYMNEGMIEGCIERAMTDVYNYKPFPKLFTKAAAILYSFIVFHPFADGNKRTAFQTTRIFLRLNGYQLIVTPEEGVRFTLAIANLEITELDSIVKWLRKHSKRRIRAMISSYMTKYLITSYYKTTLEDRHLFPQKILFITQTIKIYPD